MLAPIDADDEWQWNARSRVLVTSGLLTLAFCCLVPTDAHSAPSDRADGRATRRDTLANRTSLFSRREVVRDTATTGSIAGTIYSDAAGAPLSGAHVEVDYGQPSAEDRPASSAWSDTLGAYSVSGLVAGTVTMSITYPGYDTASFQVILPGRGVLRIDVTLRRAVVILDSVRIVSRSTTDGMTPAAEGPGGPDTWRWRRPLDSAVTEMGEPDAFRILAGDPHIAVPPESPALMDRGGAPDQLLVRIDGFPLWSPYHASAVGGALSALTPDAIAGVTLHDGALTAAFGDRLAGVLDVDTRDAPPAGAIGTVAFGPAAARAMWAHSFSIGGATGGMLIAARHSDQDLLPLRTEVGALHDQWFDGLATGVLRFSRSTIRVLAFGGGDRAVTDDELLADSSAGTRPHLPWHTETLGAVWTQRLGGDARIETRVSQAVFGATVPTFTDTIGPAARSDARQSEASTQIALGATTVGVSVDFLGLRYHVTGAATPPGTDLPAAPAGDARPLLALGANPTTTSGFVEHVWGPADSAWAITTGLRATDITGMAPRMEPRLNGAFRLASGITAWTGFARTHQYLQSLRNLATPFGAQMGMDLPIASGMAGAPVAQSDVASLGVVAPLGLLGRLTLDSYQRRISGLAVSSPFAQNAFAVRGFDRAAARINGIGAELDGTNRWVTWQAAYGLAATVEQYTTLSYSATTRVGQTATIAAAVHLDRRTQLRVATWLATGEAAPDLTMAALGHDEGDAAASVAGADRDGNATWLPMIQLPTYLRTDFEMSRTWPIGRTGGRLSSFVALANAFNRSNVAGFIPRGAGGLTPVPLLPRSLLAGISFSY